LEKALHDNLEIIKTLKISLKETEKNATKSHSKLEEKLKKMEERADQFEFKLGQQHTFIQQHTRKAKDSSSSTSSLEIDPQPAPAFPLEEFVVLKQDALVMNDRIAEANAMLNSVSQLQKTHGINIANISQTI
jgi:ribosome-binding ATPase YchF (GTP1/OBG family)